MELYHVHLHVRDLAASRLFYERHFGFRRHFPDVPELFLKNGHGFLLALAPLASLEERRMPDWFHLGFQGANAADVRALHARMTKDGVSIAEPLTEFGPETVKFHCLDPSGYRIEVRWDMHR
jgi:catechol 2,3-dioxygenase-like lactoylglutathione lyase family enzyme